jgi:predicted amidophosphoribosyltransferase
VTGRHAAPTARSRARAAAADLAGLLLPVDCAGCGAPDVPLCPGCRAATVGDPGPAHPPAPGCPPVLAAAPYDGVVREVLAAVKDHGRSDLVPCLGAALATALRPALAGLPGAGPAPAAVLVPVPSSRAAVRRRGDDVVRSIAWSAARRVPSRPDVVAALRHRRRVADQAGLGAGERVENLAGGLAVRRGARLTGMVCVPVDDVVTTGATLAEATRVLLAAGARVPVAAVVAATPRRHARGAAVGGYARVPGAPGVV